jgi:hypothetical protein
VDDERRHGDPGQLGDDVDVSEQKVKRASSGWPATTLIVPSSEGVSVIGALNTPGEIWSNLSGCRRALPRAPRLHSLKFDPR